MDASSIAEWEAPAPGSRGALHVDVEGYEGPLEFLLDLARSQKVDLTKVSVLALAEQYLEFIESARTLRIELAADYLVMAAWLAYLKSRLLLPKEEEDEPSGEELAAALQFRLRRLDAMRDAASKLVNRNRLGHDVFARGAPEPLALDITRKVSATLYDLLSAYATRRQSNAVRHVRIAKRSVWTLGEAREVLVRLVGSIGDWTPVDAFLLEHAMPPEARRGARAATFAASLELARERRIELRQTAPFAPIYMRPVRESDE